MAADLRNRSSVAPIFKTLCAALALIMASVMNAVAEQKATEAHYVLYCSGCHRLDGRGSMKGRIPDFVGSIGHIAGTEQGRSYIARVPGVKNSGLNEGETAAVLNYVLDRFGSADIKNTHYDEAEVKRYWSLPETDIVALRDLICQTSVPAGCSNYPWESGKYNSQD